MLTTVVFNPPAEHHPWLWISDGNVILSAVTMDKTRTVLFRVHKSLLSDQSEVFASMFTIPQGEENEGSSMERYEGLPLVRLPDAAEALGALLSALRDTFHLYEPSKFSDTPLRVRSALHLASKYLMNDLRAKLIRIVELQWPTTADKLEERDVILEQALKTSEYDVEEWSLMFLPEPASAILLAEEFNIPSIMPAAYYDLLRCSISMDWDLAIKSACFILAPGRKPARWNLLPRISLHKLLLLREKFELMEARRLFEALDHKKTECEDKESCRRHLQTTYKCVSRHPSKPCDPFSVMREIEEKLSEILLCDACQEHAGAQIQSIKEDIWNKLVSVCCPSPPTHV